jgi:hypothetical protein
MQLKRVAEAPPARKAHKRSTFRYDIQKEREGDTMLLIAKRTAIGAALLLPFGNQQHRISFSFLLNIITESRSFVRFPRRRSLVIRNIQKEREGDTMLLIAKRTAIGAALLLVMPVIVWLSGWQWLVIRRTSRRCGKIVVNRKHIQVLSESGESHAA